MNTEIEEQLTNLQLEENLSSKSSNLVNCCRKSKKSYTREFLLSLSELEVCKKLPNGFDESLLSEFHETSYYGPQDRPRVLGNSSLQGFRRTDYGSSPPARGDSGSYSRGLQRWDSRSSAKTEGDSDSESGRRFGAQARKTWQNPEHDGLLGSGSSPRPPGYAAGNAVPRFRPNENSKLNKSNEPYQPPRTYKVGPHARRETKDSFNDETFGSPDSTSESRAEEEKIRRAQFELMRKEQHKTLQESQKLNSGKPKDSFSEMVGFLENPIDSKISSGLDKALKDAPHDDASKVSVPSQATPIRPLVPPGFVSGAVDKSSASKSHLHGDILQVKYQEVEQVHQDVKSVPQERGSSDWFGDISNSSSFKPKKSLLSVLYGADQARGSSLPGVTEVLDIGENRGFVSEISGHKVPGEPVRSTSILDKLFGNGLIATSESTSNMLEGDDPKTDDIWSPDKLESKFARWFSEDDKKTLGNTSSEKPSSLLSLIIGGEKSGNNGLNVVATTPNIYPDIMPELKTSKSSSFPDVVLDRFGISNGPVQKPSVLTCEDLEQSMLLEIGGDISSSRSPAKEQDNFEVKKDELPGTGVDNSASQHLLSLLQGGMSSNNTASMLGLVERPTDQNQKSAKSSLPESSTNTSGLRDSNHSDKSLTLEALFGTAFMKELHTVGSGRTDFSDVDGVGSHEGSILASNDGITRSDKVEDWLDSRDTGKYEELSRLPSEADARYGGFDGSVGVKLPEEDSLINLVDPTNVENSVWIPNSSSRSADLHSLSSNTSVNIMEKLAGLGGNINDERSSIGGPDRLLLHNPHMRKPEIPYPNLHPQASSPQFHRPPMNQSRTFFHPLDLNSSHIDPHMKFMPPEAVIHRDAPTHHHFPTNMGGHPLFPHSGPDLPPFDGPIPSPVFQQMLMGGNHPPSHLVRGHPGAAPMPPHPSHTPAGFIHERNTMQGFPFGQRQPSFGGPGMPIPGTELGAGNQPPEAFQRFLEMERQANPKQMHPFANSGPSQGKFGHEFDMGYRYR
ncbi:hypothetical protein RND81_01G193700 [Saponaria officinalis]